MSDLAILKNDIKEIIQTLDKVKLETLTKSELQEIARLLKIDELKQELSKKIKHHKTDIDERTETFLAQRRSQKTRENYGRAINHFLSYLERNKVHPLEVKAYEVDQYISFLETEPFEAAQQRLYISACSSFYSTLVRWDDISHNYFNGCRKPRKKQLIPRVPATHELEYIKMSFEADLQATGRGSKRKIQSAKVMRLIVELLETTGIRVGAINTLKFRSDGSFTGFSKGSDIDGKISLDLYIRFKKEGIQFSELKTSTIKDNMGNKIQELFGDNRISCHSYRHYYTTRLYQQSKDIMLCKRKLHHSSVITTQDYLRSLHLLNDRNEAI